MLSVIHETLRNGISWVNKNNAAQTALFIFFLPLRPAVVVRTARLLLKCCLSFVTLSPRSESRRGEANSSINSPTPLTVGWWDVCSCTKTHKQAYWTGFDGAEGS